MAGGKASPRQKMINLMYLVFLAMIALNMGKQVLDAFGLVNIKFESANTRATNQISSAFEDLQTKASERPAQFAAILEQAKQIKAISSDLYNYIGEFKTGVENAIGQKDVPVDQKDYQAMDKSDYTDHLFFSEGATKGKEFVDKINSYREEVLKILGDNKAYANIVAKVKENFNTDDRKDKDGNKVKWLSFNFEGFPYIATLAKFSMMQSDILSIQQDFFSEALAGSLKSQVSMTNYTTLLEQGKGAYYQGEKFDGSIVLGRKDPTTRPNQVDIALDGRKLSANEYSIEDGRVKLNISAGNTGEHKITGNLFFDQDGERIAVPVAQSFSTIPKPNSAVISADKMNVVYRGVDNPITISMPGVPDNKIMASGQGLSKASGTGAWVMRPGQGKDVTITVTGELQGQRFSSSKLFRIKSIPRASTSIAGQISEAKLPKANLAVLPINAVLEDFDFDLHLQVNEFKVFIPGQPSVAIKGNRFNEQAKTAISRAKRGDKIQIFDVKASIVGNSTLKLPPVSPIIVEITN
nr:gliding motility protein GldM [uncultured Capnocytophaga sp.]